MGDRVQLKIIGTANVWSWETHMWWATQGMQPEEQAEMWAKYGAIRTAQWQSGGTL